MAFLCLCLAKDSTDEVRKITESAADARKNFLLQSDGSDDVEKANRFPKFISIMNVRVDLMKAWGSGTEELQNLQLQDIAEPYPGWLDLKSKESLTDLVCELTSVENNEDLRSVKALLAGEKKHIDKMLKEAKAAITELKGAVDLEKKRAEQKATKSAKLASAPGLHAARASAGDTAAKAVKLEPADDQDLPNVFKCKEQGASAPEVVIDSTLAMTHAGVQKLLLDP
jgi:hypothetical protein